MSASERCTRPPSAWQGPWGINTTCALVLGTALSCFGQASRADDCDAVLAQCTEVCGHLPGSVMVTVTRQHNHWQVTSVASRHHKASALTDDSVLPLGRLTTLDTLEIGTPSAHRRIDCTALTPEAFHTLANLHLRTFTFEWNVTDAELKSIAAMTDLVELHLGGYRRDAPARNDGLACLQDLKKLHRLNLSWAGLSDASLRYIWPLGRLEELNLNGNDISDSGLESLRGLTDLRCVTLETLGEKGVAVLEGLPHLEHLIAGLDVPTTGSVDLSNLGSLESLDLLLPIDTPHLCVRLPKGLRRLKVCHDDVDKFDLQSAPDIEEIEVARKRASGDLGDLRWLYSFPRLSVVRMNAASDVDVKQLAGLTCLRAIELSSVCYDKRFGDDGVMALTGLRNIESLTIHRYGSAVTDAGLQVVRNFVKLRQLTLANCPEVTPKGLAIISELEELRTLKLGLYDSRSKLTMDSALASVKQCTGLKELYLDGTTILSDEGLAIVAALSSLRRLNLGTSVGFSEKRLARLMRELPNLKYLTFTLPRPRLRAPGSTPDIGQINPNPD